MRFTHKVILCCMLLTLLNGCNPNVFEEADRKPPNVIFIFADQFRNYSLGIWSKTGYSEHLQGSPDPVLTPSLDKIASKGVLFSRAVSNFPLCSPYRAMLLTGMYPDQNGVTNNCRKDREVSLNSDAYCITDVFATAGYNTSYFGKCHWLKNKPLFDETGTYAGSTKPPGGHYINDYDTYVPPGKDRHNIEYFFQCIKDEHFNPRVYSNDPQAIDGKKDGELYMPRKFSAELESEVIIDYLSNTHGQRDTSKPFFMIWSLNPPHNPWNEQSTKMEFFDQYSEGGKPNLGALLTRENADTAIGHYAPYYFANVSAVDNYIGNVVEKLEDLGLAENTIIVFSSDHGEMLGSHGLRGKNVPEIEAFNIPFFVSWGDKLKHRVEDLMISVPDVLPTLAGLAGIENLIPEQVQGKNFASQLIQDQEVHLKPRSVLYINSNSRGVFTERYMMVVKESQDTLSEIYCYDNKNDPYQLNKISFDDMDPETGAFLKIELASLLKDTNDRWYQQQIGNSFLLYH